MSSFSKQGTQVAIESSANVHINAFMAQETAENIKRLREEMKTDKS